MFEVFGEGGINHLERGSRAVGVSKRKAIEIGWQDENGE